MSDKITTNVDGCGKRFVEGQWWKRCGERDMGSAQALCVHCGGDMLLEEDNVHPDIIRAMEKLSKDNITWLNRMRKLQDALLRHTGCSMWKDEDAILLRETHESNLPEDEQQQIKERRSL